MKCSCIKGIYNSHISNSGCKQLIYEDESSWMTDEGYEIPESYTVTVTTPSGSKKDIELKVSGRNVITTVDLFSSEGPMCLEDGIYCFETESCGEIVYKNTRAFLCNTECTIDKLISDADFRHDFEEIQRYRALLESVKINASQGNVETAQGVLDFLKRELERFVGCEDCG